MTVCSCERVRDNNVCVIRIKGSEEVAKGLIFDQWVGFRRFYEEVKGSGCYLYIDILFK